MAEDFIQEPPTPEWMRGGWYYSPAYRPPQPRPTHIQQTPSGPMATGALPEGWRYDMWGNMVWDGPDGNTWTYTDDGKPAKVEYSGGFFPGTVGAAGGSGPTYQITPATEDDIANDRVPISLLKGTDQRRAVNEAAKAADKARANTFGVTSPGSRPDNFPAAMGGPLNDPEFVGAEGLREATAAQHPNWSPTQIEDYVRSYSVNRVLRQAAKRYYDKGQEGTYYQRAALERAANEGYGRPQYNSGYEYTALNLKPADLVKLQRALIMAGVGGASSITIGAIGADAASDPTIVAFRNALAAANLQGVNLDAWLAQQQSINRMAERAALKDGSPGDPHFDPTRVQRITNLTGRARARAQLKQMMTQMLGRAPSEGEVDDYLATLNAREEADPTIRTTTYTRSGDSSTVTEASDVDPALIAERQIKGDNPKEYEANQRLRYYNAMLSMLGGA